ncbi:MAG: PDZ domain-containing protein [Planctomycetota bacterium]|nr:MAG: PDZ domain-containing protein [Planctomycetota bacterium]
MPRMISIACILALFLCKCTTVSAQGNPAPGKAAVLKCKHDNSQSYVCYLPRKYTPKKKWPILYCFSPSGHGASILGLFKAACERNGWIAVGSNNARNGPGGPIATAIEAMWKDTHERFSVDDGKCFSTGFSGGGTMAFTMAQKYSEHFAGVIPMATGNWMGYNFNLRREISIYYIVGTHDSPSAVQSQADVMKARGYKTEVKTFPGGHTPPPPNLCAGSVDWQANLHPSEPAENEDKIWLGVMLSPGQDGLKVTQVIEDSPAHKAGLKVGDVITSVDGKKVSDISDLKMALERKKPGNRVKLVFGRQGKGQIQKTLKLEKKGKRDAVSIAKRAAPGMKVKTSRRYRIVSNMGSKFVRKALTKMERMHKRYRDFYEIKPKRKEKLNLIVFKEHEKLKKFAGMTRGTGCRVDRTFGYFEFAVEGRPVVSRWLGNDDYSGTLANLGHEGAHQFFWTFVLDKVPLMQAWFDEGLAVNFEIENEFNHNTRFWYLKESLRKNELIPLAELIADWVKHFNSKRMLCYNECGGFIFFLTHKKSPYRKGFLKYLRDVNGRKVDPSSTGDMEKVLCRKISEVEKEFKRWIRDTEYKGPRGSK